MSSRRWIFEIGSTLVVVACAVAVVAMQGYRLAAAPDGPGYAPVEDWQEKSASGIWIGRPDAKVIVTAFVDFTCPYCRALAPVLDSLTFDQGDRVAIAFHHYSLGRTWSVPSAIAAECAHRQGRFREVARVLYEEVAGSDDNPPNWASIAENGGVPRIAEFLECIELPADSFPRIADGKKVGNRSGVRGTPTVWVNGTPTDARDLAGFKALLEDS